MIGLPLDGSERARIRPFSRAAFNSACALEAFLVIAQQDRFYAQELVDKGGCHRSYVGSLLRRLKKGGLIAEIESSDSRRNYYRKRLSPFWESVVAQAEALLGDEPGDNVVSIER